MARIPIDPTLDTMAPLRTLLEERRATRLQSLRDRITRDQRALEATANTPINTECCIYITSAEDVTPVPVDAHPGIDVLTAVKQAAALAESLQRPVVLSFNGQLLRLNHSDPNSADRALRAFYRAQEDY